MNTYYVIAAEDVEKARACAPVDGQPHQLFQVAYSPDGTKAVVQAEWVDPATMDALGQRLGLLQPNGQAEEAVYAYLMSSEWRGA